MTILPGSNEIEVIRTGITRGQYRFAIFDFDGTLSLIREGWREIMIPMMVETLTGLRAGETRTELTRLVSRYVDDLTGQQTIFQMIRLCKEVEARGGRPEAPAKYKEAFHDRLLRHIETRVEGLRTGEIDPADLTLPGTYALLRDLRGRGLELHLASGTDHDYVVREAKLLGIAEYFDDRIHGALDNYQDFSKARLIADILERNGISGSELLGFGDGYVEIENVSDVGGTAVGVASNEETLEGVNPWKRDRLVKAGAALIIPHYRELPPLLTYLFPTR